MASLVAVKWLFIVSLLIASSSADSKNNPADELVAVLNSNRTAHNSSSLYNNPGLGCIALQYIKAYQGKCDEVSGSDAKKPIDSDFAQVFAPNCGVDASTLGIVTGRLIGCQTKYVHASEAFSEVLIKDARSLSILYDKNHTEVGAGISGSDGGSPYFWCILFSSGKQNSSFVLQGGTAKVQRPGCFSGTNESCSGAVRSAVASGIVSGIFLSLMCASLFIL
ncbi:hypothetical protein EJ110_NYTH17271 [Nymphaea thermarum]|nr:hypothetical protein EJ110_NYTH17271 [Nymphaea thermarum]